MKLHCQLLGVRIPGYWQGNIAWLGFCGQKAVTGIPVASGARASASLSEIDSLNI